MTSLALISYFFPPAGTVQRPLKFAAHLASGGITTHVLAPDDPKWLYADEDIAIPSSVSVHRVHYLGPRAGRLADTLYDQRGAALALAHLRSLLPRLLLPDEAASWVLTATPAAVRLVRGRGIDVVMTSSSPVSTHLIGAAAKRATGVAWLADVRDSLHANTQRRADTAAARMKLASQRMVARLVARYADGIVTATAGIASELLSERPSAPITVIRNGCDFDDFTGLDYSPGERFRLTHAGSFYGARDPRPVLAAVARFAKDVTTRLVGDFRPRDRAYADELGLGDHVEAYGHVSHRRSLALQRDSEALLLMVPDAGGRGRGVIPAKLFEYLAAGRPILAAVPPDGEAAAIIRASNAGEVVGPEDVAAIGRSLAAMVEKFGQGRLEAVRLAPAMRHQLSREARSTELRTLVAAMGRG